MVDRVQRAGTHADKYFTPYAGTDNYHGGRHASARNANHRADRRASHLDTDQRIVYARRAHQHAGLASRRRL